MNETQKRILASAESLIAEKGLEGTTIAGIARKAQVSDSLLYQYFNGKQDVLFEVAYSKIKESIDQLNDQLQGIRDAGSRLSKFIWTGLQYHDRNQDYTRILLFECRSNKEFYSSPGREPLLDHTRYLRDILRHGVNSGAFRPDLELRLIRDMIYGVLDIQAISCMALGETRAGVDDFDDIMSLVMPMLTDGPSTPETNKRQLILDAAEKIFSENPFPKATIALVAREAGVAEGTIYDYFKNKDDLLFSVANRRFQEHMATVPRIFDIQDPVRRLRRLIRYHFMLYTTNRTFLQVFLTQILFNMSFYKSEAYESFSEYLHHFETAITEGQAAGVFRKDVNPRIFRILFLGSFSHMAIRWLFLQNDRPLDKMIEIDRVVDLLVRAVT